MRQRLGVSSKVGGRRGAGLLPFLARFFRSPLALTSFGMFEAESTRKNPQLLHLAIPRRAQPNASVGGMRFNLGGRVMRV